MLDELICPGCARTAWVSIETRPPAQVTVDFEFDKLRDGRFTIWATLHCDQPVRGIYTDTEYGPVVEADEPPFDIGDNAHMIHECPRDGGSGDREPREPLPSPPREASASGEL